MDIYISRDDSYALEHHGVKGMKWGVRNDDRKLNKLDAKISTLNKRQKEAASKYGIQSKQHKKALKKYGKAKVKHDKRYEKLYPGKSELANTTDYRYTKKVNKSLHRMQAYEALEALGNKNVNSYANYHRNRVNSLVNKALKQGRTVKRDALFGYDVSYKTKLKRGKFKDITPPNGVYKDTRYHYY